MQLCPALRNGWPYGIDFFAAALWTQQDGSSSSSYFVVKRNGYVKCCSFVAGEPSTPRLHQPTEKTSAVVTAIELILHLKENGRVLVEKKKMIN